MEKHEKQLLQQQFEGDYNFAKLTSEINELNYQLKTQDSQLRKLQKEMESRVTEMQFSETIALINAGIHSDPNILKLLKTREEMEDDQSQDKVRLNAGLFAKKLNQISESLTVLHNAIKRLESKATAT